METYIIRKKTISKTEQNNVLNSTGRKRESTFYDNVPEYHHVNLDDSKGIIEVNPVMVRSKIWNNKKDGFDIVERPVILTMSQFNTRVNMGCKVTVYSDIEIKERNDRFKKLLENAKNEGKKEALKEKII